MSKKKWFDKILLGGAYKKVKGLYFDSMTLFSSCRFKRGFKLKHHIACALIILFHISNHSTFDITWIYLDITLEEVKDLYNLQDLFVY